MLKGMVKIWLIYYMAYRGGEEGLMIFTELAEGQLSLVVAMYVCLCVCVSVPKVAIVNYAPTVRV